MNTHSKYVPEFTLESIKTRKSMTGKLNGLIWPLLNFEGPGCPLSTQTILFILHIRLNIAQRSSETAASPKQHACKNQSKFKMLHNATDNNLPQRRPGGVALLGADSCSGLNRPYE